MSPIHLLAPVVELQLEGRLADHFSLAALGGYGEISADVRDPVRRSVEVAIEVQQFGAQFAGYPLKAFDDLQLGLEVMYVEVDFSEVADLNRPVEVYDYPDGLAVGGFVGYKYVASSGFSLFVQGGAARADVSTTVWDSSGESATRSEQQMVPILNFNVGWSL